MLGTRLFKTISIPARFDHRFLQNIIIVDSNHRVMDSIFACELECLCFTSALRTRSTSLQSQYLLRLVGKFEVVVDKYRVDGSRILVAEVEVGDDSGSISLRARDEQINLVRELSNKRGAIVLRNCTVELYQGKHLRLGVSKWGKMSAYPVRSTAITICFGCDNVGSWHRF